MANVMMQYSFRIVRPNLVVCSKVLCRWHCAVMVHATGLQAPCLFFFKGLVCSMFLDHVLYSALECDHETYLESRLSSAVDRSNPVRLKVPMRKLILLTR